MTKAEIIRKLAKKVGVQDLDAKIFFEVFLQKVSIQLNAGETIKINNLGYFQVRSSNIKKIPTDKSNPISPDLIVFYPIENEKSESNESLIFNIPFKSEEGFNLIDSYFSLSFGKAVIPLEGANFSEYFIPPTGNELRRLFDTKADKLIREVEVLENYTNEDEIIITPEIINPNLERQIREDALLDTENEVDQFLEDDQLKELTWDFGERLDNIDITSQPSEDKEYSKEYEVENDNIENNIPLQKEEKKLPDDFQRVNSVITDFNIDRKNITENETESDSNINEELKNVGLAEDKHLPYNPNLEINENEIPEEVNKDPQITNEDIPYPDFSKEIQEEPVTNDHKQLRVGTNKILLKTSREIHKKTGESPAYSKRKWMGIFLLFASLIVLSGAVYLYLKFINVSYFEKKQAVNTNQTRTQTPPVVIDRDYDIPVTYPYAKDSSVSPAINPIDKSAFNQNDAKKIEASKENELKDQNNQNKQVNQSSENNKLNPISAVVKNKDFIFQTGDKYIVQISSWATERSAVKHAAYFKDKGFQTEVLKTHLDRGTWYRVRIGYFNSENEAINFYNKYR